MRSQSMYQLRPCPFCGGKPRLEAAFRAFVRKETMRVAFVRCTECQARGARVPLADYGKTSHSIEAEQAAVDLWNRRATDERSEA